MTRIMLALATTVALAGCGDTLFERTASGAAIGAGAAAVTGNNVATGAVVGAGAGVVSNAVR
jgi:hypothetical protein